MSEPACFACHFDVIYNLIATLFESIIDDSISMKSLIHDTLIISGELYIPPSNRAHRFEHFSLRRRRLNVNR